MLQIFKYFFGIIGVLILVYVLIVVIRTVLVTGITTGTEVVHDPKVQTTVSSTTSSIANSWKNFSFLELMMQFRPFEYSPLSVGYDTENSGTSFFNKDGYDSYRNQQQLYWQNMADAPNDHPTDWVPVGKSYYEILSANSEKGNSYLNSESLKAETKYIKPDIQHGERLYDNMILSGRAYFKVFSSRVFPIYILDNNGNTIGSTKAFVNGDIGDDEYVNFRGVLKINNLRNFNGYLMFKNENLEQSKIRAVTVVRVSY